MSEAPAPFNLRVVGAGAVLGAGKNKHEPTPDVEEGSSPESKRPRLQQLYGLANPRLLKPRPAGHLRRSQAPGRYAFHREWRNPSGIDADQCLVARYWSGSCTAVDQWSVSFPQMGPMALGCALRPPCGLQRTSNNCLPTHVQRVCTSAARSCTRNATGNFQSKFGRASHP
jgi:hypothetical protein